MPVYYRLDSHRDCNSLENIRYRFNSLKWAVRFDNPREFIYVFNHIPKAGGTAIRQVLSQWGAVVGDYRTDTSDSATDWFVKNRIEVDTIRRPAFVCGHYGLEGAFLDQRYPEIFNDARYRLITFLREPLEIAISTYFYAKRVGQKVAAADLDTFLRHYRGRLHRVLGAQGPLTSGLDDYWFIGISERMTDSLDLLATRIGRRSIDPGVVNETPRSAAPSAAAIAIFHENNAEDEALYRDACRRFDQQREHQLPPSDASCTGA